MRKSIIPIFLMVLFMSSSLEASRHLEAMETAAMRAGLYLKEAFKTAGQLKVSEKSPQQHVTEADINSEKIIKENLRRHFPTYSFLTEEGGEEHQPDSTHTWIIDPLDGTANFIRSYPHFCISIALADHRGHIVAALIYDPIREEIFKAERDHGAYLNNQSIHVSHTSQLTEGTRLQVELNTPLKPGISRWEQAAGLIEVADDVRAFSGSAALDLAYVAAGRLDGFVSFGLKIWDVAAGILLIEEAGGKVSEPNGENRMLTSGNILGTNQPLYLELLSKAMMSRKELSPPQSGS